MNGSDELLTGWMSVADARLVMSENLFVDGDTTKLERPLCRWREHRLHEFRIFVHFPCRLYYALALSPRV